MPEKLLAANGSSIIFIYKVIKQNQLLMYDLNPTTSG